MNADLILEQTRRIQKRTRDVANISLSVWVFRGGSTEIRWEIWDGSKHTYIEDGRFEGLTSHLDKRELLFKKF